MRDSYKRQKRRSYRERMWRDIQGGLVSTSQKRQERITIGTLKETAPAYTFTHICSPKQGREDKFLSQAVLFVTADPGSKEIVIFKSLKYDKGQLL